MAFTLTLIISTHQWFNCDFGKGSVLNTWTHLFFSLYFSKGWQQRWQMKQGLQSQLFKHYETIRFISRLKYHQ